MSGGGGGGDLLGAGLAIAAMVATDGAAAAFLPEAMGMEAGLGATMLGGAALGAGSSALGNALTGGDVGRGALMGGLAGGAMAGIGSALGPSGLPTTQVGGGSVAGGGGDFTGSAFNIDPSAAYTPTQAPFDAAGYSGGMNQAPVTATPMPGGGYDPMQASQEGFRYAGPNAAPTPGGFSTADASSFGDGYGPKGFQGGPGQTAGSNGITDWIKKNPGITALGGTAALMALINKDNKKYGIPTQTPYTGNGLQKFRYDPNLYTPNTAPRYASGGITNAMPPGGPVEQMSRDNALGQNQMFPQSQLQTNAFASPTNTPMGSNMIAPSGDVNTDPYTGAERFAAGGGISGLGSYAAGGNPRLLKGPGDGMSDNIPATIAGKQPARLADGEFVVPADVVSHLGNGSTDAGAKQLHSMMDKVRKARTGVKRQGKQIKPGKYLPA